MIYENDDRPGRSQKSNTIQSVTIIAAMKPRAPKKPVVTTSVALLPVEVADGALEEEPEVLAGDDELLVEVPLEHETFDGIVKLFDNVRSAHYAEDDQHAESQSNLGTYLEEATITTVENHLNGDVGTVLNATNVCIAEVERDTKLALPRSSGKVSRELLSRGRVEISERRWVLRG